MLAPLLARYYRSHMRLLKTRTRKLCRLPRDSRGRLLSTAQEGWGERHLCVHTLEIPPKAPMREQMP